MDIDYNKVIDFILVDNFNKTGMANVLKEVLRDFCMISINQNDKEVLLKLRSNKKDFILKRRDKGLIILPYNYRALSLGEDFGIIIEIRVNDENNVVLSSISKTSDSKNIYVVGSNWHNEGNDTYTQTIGRMIVADFEKFSSASVGKSIEMFINQYNNKRNDIFCDLYWDMNSYLKIIFVEPKNLYKVQINDGYLKESFEDLYKKFNKKTEELLKPKMF